MAKIIMHIAPPMSRETGIQRDFSRLKLEEEILEGETLYSLLNRLSSTYGSSFRRTFFDIETGQIKNHIIVMVNNRVLIGLERSKVLLQDRDTVFLLPSLSGG